MPFVQCRMIKQLENGYKEDTSFIPIEHAKVNKVLNIKKDDGDFEDGWTVIEVGIRITDEQASKMHEWYTAFKKKEVAGRRSFKVKGEN